MGMSIDEAIKQLETYTIPCGKYKAAYDLAVDTMRKYQKIEDLVNDCADESVDDTSCCARYIGLIEEVIYTGEQEDGNVD